MWSFSTVQGSQVTNCYSKQPRFFPQNLTMFRKNRLSYDYVRGMWIAHWNSLEVQLDALSDKQPAPIEVSSVQNLLIFKLIHVNPFWSQLKWWRMFLHICQISLLSMTKCFSESDLIKTCYQMTKNDWYMFIKLPIFGVFFLVKYHPVYIWVLGKNHPHWI